MRIIAFDVDETLDVSGGPVPVVELFTLHALGDVVGLCGNWALAIQRCPELLRVVSFIGPMEMAKDAFLMQIRRYIPAEEYIMVGNVLGVSGASDDEGAAVRGGWHFVKETDYRRLLI